MNIQKISVIFGSIILFVMIILYFSSGGDLSFFSIVLFSVIAIFVEWLIGKTIGNVVTKGTGLVLGIILILFFPLFLMGIAVIIYSNRNKDSVNINVNLTSETMNNNRYFRNVTPNDNYDLPYDNETKKCPFCAEEIKQEAIICRFCGKEITNNNKDITKIDEYGEFMNKNENI